METAASHSVESGRPRSPVTGKRPAGGRRLLSPTVPLAAPHMCNATKPVDPRWTKSVATSVTGGSGWQGPSTAANSDGPTRFRLDQLGLVSPQCVLDRLKHRPQLGAVSVLLDEIDHPPKDRPFVRIRLPGVRCSTLMKTSRGNSP